MAEPFSLKDHLFNPATVAQLAAEYAATLPDFDAAGFQAEALAGFDSRGLLERLEWLAGCLEPHLADDFPTMADQLEAAMPPVLDPALTDGDFGKFIHAVPGILAVRHGLERHRQRAMALLYQATQRFSMEFYVRPFLNRWPQETLDELAIWARDDNYHVRRLASEGTRARLPWAQNVALRPDQTLPLLDLLHADPTRYVTRSVANHLNDLSKTVPDLVLDRLQRWQSDGAQDEAELAWLRRHALRSLIKAGHPGAMRALGYLPEARVEVALRIDTPRLRIGDVLRFSCTLRAAAEVPVLVDYRIGFARPEGKSAQKVFKLKQAVVHANRPLEMVKAHRLKGDATTFTLHPGAHRLIIQVNGVDRAEACFELEPQAAIPVSPAKER